MIERRWGLSIHLSAEITNIRMKMSHKVTPRGEVRVNPNPDPGTLIDYLILKVNDGVECLDFKDRPCNCSRPCHVNGTCAYKGNC
eukprot:10854049-Ditylum_brightwellii.AAC.1